MTGPVYLDHNATSPLRPEALAAMQPWFGVPSNASSVHGFGRKAKAAVEEARELVALLAGADPAGLTFTGSASEANNLALRGTPHGRLPVSAIEHPSVLTTARELGAEIVPVTPDGVVDLDALASLLADGEGAALVSIMAANNETGVLQPVAEASEIVHRHGGLFHVDAVQGAGKVALDMAAMGADMMSLSAHKIGGPQGVGCLIAAPHVMLAAEITGGGQERGRRAGTENVAGIVGFGAAAEAARAALADIPALAALRDRLEAGACDISPKARVYGGEVRRLPNTTCLMTPGINADVQLMSLDMAGVAVSSGSACSSGKVSSSHVLRAMGATEREAASAIRVSLGWTTTADDVTRFLEAYAALVARALGNGAPGKSATQPEAAE